MDNKTLYTEAYKIIKENGNTKTAYDKFCDYINKNCDPPLSPKETDTIWQCSLEFVKSCLYHPADYTDLGQATVMATVFAEEICYCKGIGYMFYDGKCWRENNIKARGLAQKLTDIQFDDAKKQVQKAQEEVNAAIEHKAPRGIKESAKEQLRLAEEYRNYVLKRRETTRISATLKELEPKVEIDISRLDRNPYILNTPAGIVDLQTGILREHDSHEYCTKITNVAPSDAGKESFEKFISQVTSGDEEYAQYLQMAMGMCAIGSVKQEKLLIAYGGGGNGKSTFFNSISRVLGDYACTIASDVLITKYNRNKGVEYAELRGKRYVTAAELEEGMRIDTATIKKICSTDKIHAEKKYKDPFDFEPSHTVVLFTNHLPSVGSIDSGTWDRLVVLPFTARFRGQKGEILNYAEMLFENSGEAILAWIIEGARLFIRSGYKLPMPKCVAEATEEYKVQNDWLHRFLNEYCDEGEKYEEKSSVLYAAYKDFCERNKEYFYRTDAFKEAMCNAGFKYRRTNTGMWVKGVKAKKFLSGKTSSSQNL